MLLMVITAMENDDNKTFMLNLYTDYYGLVRLQYYPRCGQCGRYDQ